MTEPAPKPATLAPLLAAIVLLECGLKLVAWICLPPVREAVAAGHWPAWLIAGAPPELAGQIADQETGLALTCAVRLLQIACAWLWVRRAGLEPRVGLGFAWSPRALAVALGGLAFVTAGSGALEVGFRLLGQGGFVREVLFGGGPEPGYRAWPLFAVTFAAQVVIGPLAEEIVCRGLIYVPLRRSRGVVVGTLVSAAIFALLHLPNDPAWLLFYATGGVLFAAACELGRGLAAPFLFHAAFNSALVVLQHPALWG